MTIRKTGSILCVLVVGAILLPLAGKGQVTTGSISGTIRDESGAVVAGAKVTVTNTRTGIARSGLSDQAGRYNFPQLAIGSYEVQAEMAGFQTGVRQGIELTVARHAEVDLSLRVGAVVEKMVVTGEAPLVESQSATISSLVEAKTVSDLPLNGRNFDQLIALSPGTLQFRSKGSEAVSGLGNLYSVGGARYHSNKFMIDGTEMLGGGSMNSNSSSAAGTNLGVEAIAEFRVLTNNYGAEYGKKAGGTISVISKSGTNQFHGSVFEFLRNDNLDARNFFAPDKQQLSRNNFGASAGGPITRDRTFFFGTFEAFRERLGLTQTGIFPDRNALEGYLPDPRTGELRFIGVAPEIKPFLALYPIPNGRVFGDGSAENVGNHSRPINEDFVSGRIDHQLRESDSLWGSFRFDDAERLEPELNPRFYRPYTSRQQMYTIQETHLFSPAMLNVLRGGFGRWAGLIDGGAPRNESDNLRFASFYERIGEIRVGGGSTAATQLDNFTGATSPKRIIVNNTFEGEDQVTITAGAHAIKTGVHLQRLQKNIDGPTGRFGRYDFDDLEGLLRGRARIFVGPPATAISPRGFRQILVASYVQDDWKVKPNLTLNLGLRYEVLTAPSEVNGMISNWASESINGFLHIKTAPDYRNPPYANNSTTAFAPRFGFAWQPFGHGRTVLRGGGGIFYDHLLDFFGFFLTNNPPFTTLNIPNPPFPEPFRGTGTAPTPQIRGTDYDLDVPTRAQYNLQIQQELGGSTVLSVGYVGSSSYHLTRSVNSNTALPTQILPDGTKFFAAGLRRRNPDLGATGRYILTDANGKYNSLQVELRNRLTRGLRFQTSFTWAKSVDDASELLPGEASVGQLGSAQDPDTRNDRGPSMYDIRRTFAANFNYEFLFANRLSGAAGKLLGGWQLNGIISLSDGTPITPGVGFNRSRNLDQNAPDRPNLRAGAGNNPVQGGPDLYYDPTVFELPPVGFFGNLGRNTIIGPGLATVDLSLFKNTSLTERLNLQFRAETFNLFNRANFGLPRNSLFEPSGNRLLSAGRITDTVTTSRQIQFGLKLLW